VRRCSTIVPQEAKRRNRGAVVVYKLDRLARDVHGHATIRAAPLRHGIQVWALAWSLPTTLSR